MVVLSFINLVSFAAPELNVLKRGSLAVSLPKRQGDNEVQLIYTGKSNTLLACTMKYTVKAVVLYRLFTCWKEKK